MAVVARNTLTSTTKVLDSVYSSRWKTKAGSVVSYNTYNKRNGYKNVPFVSLITRPPPLAYIAEHHRVFGYIEGTLKLATVPPTPNWYQGVGSFWISSNIISEFAVRASASHQSQVENGAAANANANVKSQYYSAFETLYEGKKTCKMILSAVTTLTSAVRDLRRGNFTAVAKHLGIKTPKNVSARRSIGNNWLEYRYGWIPLYSTVYGEMKRQYDLLKPKQPLYHAMGYSRQRYSGSTMGGWVAINCGAGDNMGGTQRRKAVGSGEISSEVGYTYRVHNQTLANTSSLGLTNPALLTWEAIPFSFVADWFVNVSDSLSQFDTFAGKEFVSGYRTTIERLLETRSVEFAVGGAYSITVNKPVSISKESVWMTRSVLSAPPVINLRFSPGLNVKRVTDAVALLAQVVRR